MEGQENQGTNNVANNGETNNTGAVTQTAGTQTKTEGTVTQTVNKTEAKQEEKTFTQEEVNAMLAKEKKNLPSKEDLKAFNEWKEAQKTDEDKRKEEVIKMQNLQVDNDFKTQMVEIMKKGVSYEDAEFIQFKLSKKEGDFEENLENYLKDNPKYTQKEEEKKSETTGFSQNNTGKGISEDKAYLDKKSANNPYYKK